MQTVKITMDVKYTPEEARKFLGLLDVQPPQATLMTDLEKRMRSEMDRFSPEGLINTWFSSNFQNAEWLRGVLKSMLDQTGKTGSRSE